MRKILFIITLLLSTFLFSQRKPITISGFYSGGNISQVGLSLERGKFESKKKQFSSYVLNISLSNMDYEANNFKTNGNGFEIAVGSRTYFNKNDENKKLYLANFMSYGNIKFDENLIFTKFEGTFSYFSLFSPEIGYKLKAGNFAIDPFLGIMWQWQIKGKGDVDNVNVNVWQPRLGLRIGYQF